MKIMMIMLSSGLGEYSQSPGIKSGHISKDSDRMNIQPLSPGAPPTIYMEKYEMLCQEKIKREFLSALYFHMYPQIACPIGFIEYPTTFPYLINTGKYDLLLCDLTGELLSTEVTMILNTIKDSNKIIITPLSHHSKNTGKYQMLCHEERKREAGKRQVFSLRSLCLLGEPRIVLALIKLCCLQLHVVCQDLPIFI